MVAMAVGSAVLGQSVPRSARVSCLVMFGEPGAMVETWWMARGSIQSAVEGPTGWPSVLVPTAEGMYM